MTTEPHEEITDQATQEAEASSSAADTDNAGAADANLASHSSSDGTEPDAKEGEDTEPKSLLDVVKSAVEDLDTGTEEPGEEPSPAKSEQDSEPEQASADAADNEDVDEDGKPLPFHKHPRWQQVKADRDKWKGEAETLRGDAEQYQAISNYMKEKDLNNDEVAQGFQVMALVKNDPAAALEYFEGAVSTLRQYLGKELPEDLTQAVQFGEISEARAQELSEARAAQQHANQASQQAQQQMQAQAQANANAQRAQAIQGAVTAWEANVTKTDPDYSKKSEMVLTYAKALRADAIGQGMDVNSPEVAVQLVQKAYEAVNNNYRTMNPVKPATDPTPTSSVSAKAAAPAAPNSLLEAARQGASMAVTQAR